MHLGLYKGKTAASLPPPFLSRRRRDYFRLSRGAYGQRNSLALCPDVRYKGAGRLSGRRDHSEDEDCVMRRPLQLILLLGVIGLLVAVADFMLRPAASPVRSTLRTVRNAAVKEYQQLTQTAATNPQPAPSAAAPAAVRTRPATSSPVFAAAPEATRAPDRAAAAAAPIATSPSAPAASVESTLARREFYLPGRSTSWLSPGVTVRSPIVIRAGGRVLAGQDGSGPNGVRQSFDETSRRQRPGSRELALSEAPYLALIGRVCSTERCSDPFTVGSSFVLCPSDMKISGDLQLWTNNYVQVDGRQTSSSYSNTSGGYTFYVESASDAVCASAVRRVPDPAASIDAQALAAGQTLRSPGFVISSSQSTWKPFFVPLSKGLVIRSSGSMQPRGGAESTGPLGIAVPPGAAWSYPGDRDLTVDADHRLLDPALPYQALIGRLCGQADCTAPFLVGTEHTICPLPQFADRLELWVNHIIGPVGLLASKTPLTLDTLTLQARRGEYRFELMRAPSSACGG